MSRYGLSKDVAIITAKRQKKKNHRVPISKHIKRIHKSLNLYLFPRLQIKTNRITNITLWGHRHQRMIEGSERLIREIYLTQ